MILCSRKRNQQTEVRQLNLLCIPSQKLFQLDFQTLNKIGPSTLSPSGFLCFFSASFIFTPPHFLPLSTLLCRLWQNQHKGTLPLLARVQSQRSLAIPGLVWWMRVTDNCNNPVFPQGFGLSLSLFSQELKYVILLPKRVLPLKVSPSWHPPSQRPLEKLAVAFR